MSPAEAKPKSGRARRDELRSHLLAIVEEHLRAGRSFADLGVAELATEAGISRSTFYAYFIDKANLLRAWYADSTDVILRAAREWWRLDGSATRSDVRAALEGIVRSFQSHPQLIAATHEAVGYDREVRHVVESAMRLYIEGLQAHIEHGQATGFVDPSLPPAETAYWLQWMAERGLQQLGRAKPAVGTARLIDAYAAIVWNTLYAEPRRSSPGAENGANHPRPTD
ncbi:TetR/AcrR family transcriptional regulator [Pseudonocardia sp. Cha107L01]|uniref:TetR/AcrR family transcriptional regulator n=1 Tax=Pseudonocardia sp. Cha107L01 TaxID=3457576 RepID=UPI00403E7EE2